MIRGYVGDSSKRSSNLVATENFIRINFEASGNILDNEKLIQSFHVYWSNEGGTIRNISWIMWK